MPYSNPMAEASIYNTDTTIILKGCAVVPSGGLTTRAANVTHTVLEDDWFLAVANMDIPASSGGTALQLPMSNVLVRLASDVTKGDILNVANALGEFQKAKIGSKNVGLIALSNGLSGTNTTWACPMALGPL